MAIAGLSNPQLLLETAEVALLPRLAAEENYELHRIAPNPFREGRARQAAKWDASRERRARRLIWC